MAILFVASEAFELKSLADKLTGLRPLKWPLDYAEEGVWQGKRYLLTANGAGPKLASHCVEVALRATSMAELSASKLEAVVSTGLCGALQPELKFGDIIEAVAVLTGARNGEGAGTPVRDQDTDQGISRDINRETEGSASLAIDQRQQLPCPYLQNEPGVKQGVLLSIDRVAGTVAEKEKLKDTGALAIEMEAVGVVRRALAAQLPFCVLKIVSDAANEEFVMDFNAMRSPAGRFSRGKIILYALTHPPAIPRLFSLRRRSKEAASALGDFLASCRFKFNGAPAEAGAAEE